MRTIVPIPPTHESQLRPLVGLSQEDRIEAWQTAVDTAPDGKITASHVERVARAITNNDMPHVSHNSGQNEWYTPPKYIDAARAVMGNIDLDPASSSAANDMVQADEYYTLEDDGLAYDWSGKVWMNPPYSQPLINEFCKKFAEDYQQGLITEGCVLVNNATDTGWYHALLEHASAVCFIKGRVKFIDENGEATGAPLQGQTILYFGDNTDGFWQHFGEFGRVLFNDKG